MINRSVRALVAGAVLLAATATGCAEIEEATTETYQPASLSAADEGGIKTVTLTEEAAERVELTTAAVKAQGKQLMVPYEAVIYDGQGLTWAYTQRKPLTYKRVRVAVATVIGRNAMLSIGPPSGTLVVTNGSTQVYGAELEMEGKH